MTNTLKAMTIAAVCTACSHSSPAPSTNPEKMKMPQTANPITVRFELPVSPEVTWGAWTENAQLQKWLTRKAAVEPKAGGKYELFWEPDTPDRNSTLGCKITAYEQPTKLAFEWRGPPQFAHLMNTQPFSTHATVSFKAVGASSTEILFEHHGWGTSSEWQAARAWQEQAWRGAFEELRKLSFAKPPSS